MRLKTNILLVSQVVIAAGFGIAALAVAGPALAAASCPNQNPNHSIQCTAGNSWCGNTCQAEPSCGGEKSKVDCAGCSCICPDARPNDCTGINSLCQATNTTCATLHKDSVCDATPGVTTQRCGNCSSGYTLCMPDVCLPATNPACPPPGVWDPCTNKCTEKYVLAKPTGAQIPQPVDLKMVGNMSLGGGDIYMSDAKALRIDNPGQTYLNVGNWDPAGTAANLMVYGSVAASDMLYAGGITTLTPAIGDKFPAQPPDETLFSNNICFVNGTKCRNSWPIGLPETALAGQTVRYTGSDWVANSFLTNTGTAIGIGTNVPGWPLDVRSPSGTAMLNIDDQAGNLWTGIRLARKTGADTNKEKWFIGMDGLSEPLQFNYNGLNQMVIDTSGRVGIGTSTPTNQLEVVGGNMRLARPNDGADLLFQMYNQSVPQSWTSGIKGAGGDYRLSPTVGLNSSALSLTSAYQTGFGTDTPGFTMDISGRPSLGTAIVRLDQGSGTPKVWTGFRVDRVRGSEQWYLGMNDVDEKLRLRSGSSTDRVVVDPTSGNVGIGDDTPLALLTVGANERFRVEDTGDVQAAGDVAVNGGDLTTNAATAALFNTSATLLNVGGAANTMNLAGGMASTGCTIDVSGNLTCTGNIKGADTGEQGYWTRTGTVLTSTHAGDSVSLTGSLTTTGSISTTNNGSLSVSGNVTLGDNATDVLNVMSENMSIANNLNIDNGNIYMDAANNRLGLGTTTPGYRLDLSSQTGTSIVRIDQGTGTPKIWTGYRIDRSRGAESWYFGLNDTDDKLRVRRAGTADVAVFDSAANRVGINKADPAYTLDVAGTVRANGFRLEVNPVANYVLTSDPADPGNAIWSPIQYADECTGGKFHHLTATSYDGADLGNYKNVDAACGAGNHICTPDEIMRTVFCSPSGTMPAAGNYAWVANGPPGFTSPAANDCGGWSSRSSTFYGDFWQFDGDNGGSGFATGCNAKYKVACCRNYWW